MNTGKNVGKASLRKTIVETNCEAAVEIARQLRLRDLSGIIIIDFIDMEEKEDKETVLATLREALRGDRMRSVILGMTELGFVELTRKKLRANLADTLQTTCPYCKGSGKVLNAETVALKIRSALIARVSEGAGAQQRFTVAASRRLPHFFANTAARNFGRLSPASRWKSFRTNRCIWNIFRFARKLSKGELRTKRFADKRAKSAVMTKTWQKMT